MFLLVVTVAYLMQLFNSTEQLVTLISYLEKKCHKLKKKIVIHFSFIFIIIDLFG